MYMACLHGRESEADTSISMSDSGSSAPDPEGAVLSATNAPLYSMFGGGRRVTRAPRAGGQGRVAPPATGRPGAQAQPEDTPQVGSRLVPIDFTQLESNLRNANDGCESELFSEEEDDHPTRAQPLAARKKPRHDQAADALDATFNAAFVTREDEDDGASVFSTDTHSQAGSEQVLERQIAASKRIFSVRGVTCLGCALDQSLVSKVDVFIRANQHRLEPNALFKSASAFFKHTIVDPAALHENPIPHWEWKDLRSHYLLHAVDPVFQRIDALRSLAACRKTVEASLMRVDEDGSRSLDPKNADLLLKIVTLQSRELGLLGSTSMPPPPPRK